MNVNFWLGCGRLTKDAEQSVTKKGTSMSKFRLAVNDRRNDETLFLNVLCFGKMLMKLGRCELMKTIMFVLELRCVSTYLVSRCFTRMGPWLGCRL